MSASYLNLIKENFIYTVKPYNEGDGMKTYNKTLSIIEYIEDEYKYNKNIVNQEEYIDMLTDDLFCNFHKKAFLYLKTLNENNNDDYIKNIKDKLIKINPVYYDIYEQYLKYVSDDLVIITKLKKCNINNDCIICLDKPENKEEGLQCTTCQKAFCKDCIIRWASFNTNCPNCRKEIV